jgi:hypothetical protein
MFIKRSHTTLIDEMFQFPKGKNDDILDGLWYAVNKARPPVSKRFDAVDFLENNTPKNVKRTAKRVISWVTGQKI